MSDATPAGEITVFYGRESKSEAKGCGAPASEDARDARLNLIEWREWSDDCQPPTDRAFLAWLGGAAEPFAIALTAADDEGCVFWLCGSSEAADVADATHWAEMPKGPR